MVSAPERGEKLAEIIDRAAPGWRTGSVPTGPIIDPEVAAQLRSGIDELYPELTRADRKRDSGEYVTPTPMILSRPPLDPTRIVIGEYSLSTRSGRITQDMTVVSTGGADPVYYSGGPTRPGDATRRHAHDFAYAYARDGSYGGREVKPGHYHFDDHEIAAPTTGTIPDDDIRRAVEAARHFIERTRRTSKP